MSNGENSNTLPRRNTKIHRNRVPPSPPPRKSSIPVGIEAISTEVEKPLKPVLQNILQEEDSINSNSSRNMCAHYKPSLPHIPKKQQSTRSSLSRSRSCDHLAVQVDSDQRNRNKTADEKNSDKSVSPLPAMASKKLVMVPPPIYPRQKLPEVAVSTSSSVISSKTQGSSSNISLQHIATSLATSFPLRVELLEGYMSNSIPHITLSTSDMFNIHLLKQQEVIRVKDSNSQVYSIPMYSSIEIGLVQSFAELGGGGKNTVPKITKASDIMAMKELPVVICATKSVHSSVGGENSSIEEKEVLFIRGIKKHPNSKKKKVLEVFSVNKLANKILYPDCLGHFSISPSLTRLPLHIFFKNIQQPLPLQAYLYFKQEDKPGISHSCEMVLPPYLTQQTVIILDKAIETSLIASPYFEDISIDLSDSENLMNIPVDQHLGKVEVAVVNLKYSIEKNSLYNQTCIVHKNISLSKIKYYHDAKSEAVHRIQTCLYTNYLTKGRMGVKMDLPVWNEVINRSFINGKGASDYEEYETISEVFNDGESTTPKTIVYSKPSKPKKATSTYHSQSSSSVSHQFERNQHDRYSGSILDDRVFSGPEGRPPCPPPTSSSIERHAHSFRVKHTRSTSGHSDVNLREGRPPCPIPIPTPRSPHMSQTCSTVSNNNKYHEGNRNLYQTPRQALASNSPSASSLDKELKGDITSSHMLSVTLPPRDLYRPPPELPVTNVGIASELESTKEDFNSTEMKNKYIYHVPKKHKVDSHSSQVNSKSHIAPHNTVSSSKSLPHASTSDLDDEVQYEEMHSIGANRSGVSRVGRTRLSLKLHENDNSTESKVRGSYGYEIFHRPISSKDMKELETQIQSLSKELKDLSEQFKKLEEDKFKDLKLDVEDAMKRIAKLEKTAASSSLNDDGRLPSVTSNPQSNQEYLMNLSTDELKRVFEGMGMKQYNTKIEQEALDGQILVELDEATLTNEMGVTSSIHRLKIIKLIKGDYDASTYLQDSHTSP